MKPLLLLFLCTLLAAEVQAWRCGNSLITTGDYRKEVRADCGKPAARYSQQVAYELEIGSVHQRRRYQAIDYWVYLLGDNKFARVLYFEDGVLKDIRQGDYGREFNRDPSKCRRENSSIKLNQTKPELELRCGPPDIEHPIEEYTAAVALTDSNRVFKDIAVDEWLYLDGDRLWVYRFENGVLKWQGEADPEDHEALR